MTAHPEGPIPYFTPAAPLRPVSVIVLSVIGIILGGLGSVCLSCSLAMMFVDFGVPNAMMDVLKSDPLVLAWTYVSTTAGWLMSVVLLVSSIGSILLRSWARKGMVFYGIIQTVLGVAGMVISIIILQPRMTEAMQQAGVPAPAWQNVMGYVMSFLGIGYAICVWYFFTRPDVKAAFDTAEAAAI